MSSSSSSASADTDSVVIVGLPLLAKCSMCIKGGGVDDDRLQYTVGLDKPFNSLFLHYARRAGVRPEELRYNRGQLITPTETPYERDFCKDEVVLVYNRDDEPVAANPRGVTSNERLLFHISDLFERRNTFQFRARYDTPMTTVFTRWASDNRVDPQRVRLWLNGVDLHDNVTVQEAGIRDGTYLYAHIEPQGFERRRFHHFLRID